ncbi:cytochrome c [Flavobacterium zepuense]|uniref:Cytochrome c n=1 Tax=Flavobacterium zepuense TaxID=2593302 RepID=A0A552UVY5_9FLAO|nr:cytochrome c [Flavobacterium zepuense]TRW22369.1 cytochrome c [Flavobacterium zepuense]
MKKYIYIPLAALALYSCDSNTYAEIEADVPPVDTIAITTYQANVKAIIDNNCVSCHSDGGQASFRDLTTYAGVVDAVQNAQLLDRIQRQNGEPGQMPTTGRMPQGNINIILQWNTDGLPEQ